jgi:predicted transcriptional regulator
MTLHVSPELEARVSELARAKKREPDDVLNDLLEGALDDEAYRLDVEAGLAEDDRDEVVAHDQVMRDVRETIERHGSRKTQ